jgi:hypothetical protein
MRTRPILLFLLMLSTGYAVSTTAYADEAGPYWSEQVMQAPDTTSPIALCISAFALTATLLLRRIGAGPQPRRRPRHQQMDFDSQTMVFSRSDLAAADRQLARRRAMLRAQMRAQMRAQH